MRLYIECVLCLGFLTAFAKPIEEVKDPKECGACPRNLDPVCGSDNENYGNECMLNFKACMTNNTELKMEYRGPCRESNSNDRQNEIGPCAKEKNKIFARFGNMIPIGARIPRCDHEGYYEKMQCSGSTGSCWCVDPMGTREDCGI